MSYTARLTVTIPPDLIEIGRAITRALDPDLGGAESWMPIYSVPGDQESAVVSYVADTPCTPEFKQSAVTLLHRAAHLHAVIVADYEARWPDLTPPSLEDCAQFCAGAVITPDPEPETDNDADS